jgi:hypothetical protein
MTVNERAFILEKPSSQSVKLRANCFIHWALLRQASLFAPGR